MIIESSGERMFLPAQQWTRQQVVELLRDDYGIDCTNALVEFGDACTVDTERLICSSDKIRMWTRTQVWIEVNNEALMAEHDVVGDVLANYAHGGGDAVSAYLESRESHQ